MNSVEIATLSFRLAALYVWLQAFLLASQFSWFLAVTWNSVQERNATLLGCGVAFVLLCAFGTLLFSFAPALALRMFSGAAHANDQGRPDVGAVALRLFGIVLFDQALTHVARVISSTAGQRDSAPMQFPMALVATLLFATGGAWLFLRAPVVARRLFRPATSAGETSTMMRLQAIAFAVLGLWIMASQLPAVVEWGFALVQRARQVPLEFAGPLPRDWFSVVHAGFGLLLVLNARALAAGWHWIQNAGVRTHSAGISSQNERR